ncbi:DUF6134 family protein [Piscinibacter sakaiensis]|uniref:DUF3108 domain-containing protein n=1 Tax=Piscinibacter sakaiensis TaxID=1547922 RepID=A0A0K8P884_PISS1|nr:DUF6134 family protein [Piscinibacter sakaiensis]GAP38847.1 hypothetical protein ISF6_5506 [Piscinibacter sakaiensis]
MRTGPALLLAAAALVAQPAAAQTADAATGPASGTWAFEVLLDGQPIGSHRFELRREGEERVLDSRAEFTVRILGIPAYRYHHHAVERWRGDCLASLEAQTDDDGKRSTVKARRDGGVLAVSGPRGETRLEGCVMSFAYWHPAMQRQTRLLNAQTGVHEPVRIEPVGTDAQGRHLRLSGPEQPVDLWYDAQGDWQALASKVSGGKRSLSYRRVRP